MKKIPQPRICVIGAGCSGITAVKNLLQAGLENVVCYEQNDQVGGNWIFSAKDSHSSVCETTHIISSKRMSEYLDFAMPDDYPDYPSHGQLLRYFQSYAEHFGVLPHIRFNTRVKQVQKLDKEKWSVALENGMQEVFDYLVVANGHHSVPRMPSLPGKFTGQLIHAHSYKFNKPFEGKKVLVIGIGNSGCDCAVECSRVADFVAISARSAQYIIPKFFMGKPSDHYNDRIYWMPKWLHHYVSQAILRITVGKYEDYGLLSPKKNVLSMHPTMNSELLYKIKHGKVHVRRAIKKVEGKQVTFENGVIEEYDTIIAATGYKISFPFFEKEFISYENSDRVPLYLRMFHPEHSTLAFVGLCQPQGAIWPLSDAQSRLLAADVLGYWNRPDNIKQLAEADSDFIEKHFNKAKRHTIEVHYQPYLRKLLKEAGLKLSDIKKEQLVYE